MQMSLPNPDRLPYSSFQATARSFYNVVIKNYPHSDILDRMADLRYLKNEKILTTEFVSRIAGNYSPEVYRKFAEDAGIVKFTKHHEVFGELIGDCSRLNELIRMRDNRVLSDEEAEKVAEEYEQLSQDIPIYIQTEVMPLLLKIERCNWELTAPYRYDNFTASISSCTAFRDLSRLFIVCFFEFSCYADKTQRMKVLELAVRKGKELLPTLPAVVFHKHLLGDVHCDCCFWLFLHYFDLAKTMRYDIYYRVALGKRGSDNEAFEALLLSIDEKQTQLLRPFGKKNALSPHIRHGIRRMDFEYCGSLLEDVVVEENGFRSPYSKQLAIRYMDITAPMLRQTPGLSYTIYAMDYLFTDSRVLNLERARTNDILVHMAPLFTLDFECSVALLMGLHPRLGSTRERIKMARIQERDPVTGKKNRAQYRNVVETLGSPIYQLDEGLVKKIWEFVAGGFDEFPSNLIDGRSHHVKRQGNGCRRIGKRELKALSR
jgi:hypothetical protein